MLCRRCGNDIVEGSEMCPVCGISQKTYITPRNYDNVPVSRKKRPRGYFISMLAMIVAVAGVFGMIYLSNKETEKVDYEKVLSAYNAEDEDLLMLSVGQYLKKHPNSNRADEVQGYLNKLRGIDDNIIDAEQESPEDLAERLWQAELERLKSTASDDILCVDSVVLGKEEYDRSHSLTIYWRNMSKKTISEIQFKVVAYGADGKEFKCEQRERSDITARADNEYVTNREGGVYQNIWLNAWYGSGIDHIEITRIRIYYDDETSQVLPAEVIPSIMQSST